MLTNSTIYRNGNCGRGALGGFFTMANDESIYGISNNHVIANINNCNVGDFIFDATGNQIGHLTHWVPLRSNNAVNTLDVSLFKYSINEAYEWRMPVKELVKPVGYIDPLLDGYVYMMLENNTQKWGFISASYINYTVNFSLCGSNFSFTHIIEITPFDNIPFSVPGESGSIIMSSNHCITGLLMGTNIDKTKSYAIPFVNGILNVLPLKIL